MAETAKYILYHYDPSFVAAVIFIILFVITTFLHVFQLAWKRTWYFIPFVIGGFCKTTPSRYHESSANCAYNSRVHRLHWTSNVCEAIPQLDHRPLHNPKSSPLTSASSLRSIDIHGPLTNHNIDRWRKPFADPSAMAHKGVRHRRRSLFLSTISRYLPHNSLSELKLIS
jgi:hypothetical protein